MLVTGTVTTMSPSSRDRGGRVAVGEGRVGEAVPERVARPRAASRRTSGSRPADPRRSGRARARRGSCRRTGCPPAAAGSSRPAARMGSPSPNSTSAVAQPPAWPSSHASRSRAPVAANGSATTPPFESTTTVRVRRDHRVDERELRRGQVDVVAVVALRLLVRRQRRGTAPRPRPRRRRDRLVAQTLGLGVPRALERDKPAANGTSPAHARGSRRARCPPGSG